MDKKKHRGIGTLAILYPFFVILLLPEVINSIRWFTWLLLTVVRDKCGLKALIDKYVGIGLIYSLIIYIIFFLIGAITIVMTLVKQGFFCVDRALC